MEKEKYQFLKKILPVKKRGDFQSLQQAAWRHFSYCTPVIGGAAAVFQERV